MTARSATKEDIDELLRLRAVMLRALYGGPWNDDWLVTAREFLEQRLAGSSPTLAAFVVDRPSGDGLASCVVGAIDERLASPGNPDGLSGYVNNVATDPDMRRRGYSRACMTALLEWFATRGIRRVNLLATPDGEPLYESLGFTRTESPSMRITWQAS
jgi:GNAT superfamily N-acetyltransferase